MTLITCCKDCIAPKRHIGCHSDCKQYIKEKAEFEEEKKKMKENKNHVISTNEFNMLFRIKRTHKSK